MVFRARDLVEDRFRVQRFTRCSEMTDKVQSTAGCKAGTFIFTMRTVNPLLFEIYSIVLQGYPYGLILNRSNLRGKPVSDPDPTFEKNPDPDPDPTEF